MTFRKSIFWLHLIAGLIAGLSIAIMCFTGSVLAFEQEIVAFAEREVRHVSPANHSTRLPLSELAERVSFTHPEAKVTAIAISSDPSAAVVFQLGRDGALYANPYTGAIAAPATTRTRDFMHLMEDWHRWLALSDEQRPLGKAINGAGNLAFFVLAVTGLFLWWPRKWRTKGLKRSLWFIRTDTAKARDWNWHNVIGLWSAPVLIVLTLTALPISYRWAGNLIYTLAGEEVPTRTSPPRAAGPDFALPVVPEGTPSVGPDAFLATAQQTIPPWSEIILRLSDSRNPQGLGPDSRTTGPQPVTVSVKTQGSWPRTATTSLTLNPYTAEVLQKEIFGELTTARQIRSWTRFLHTGEALGGGGQLIAGLASLGGCFLVYTGFALAWHRFVRWRKARSA